MKKIAVRKIDTSMLNAQQKKVFQRAWDIATGVIPKSGDEPEVAFSPSKKFMYLDCCIMGWKCFMDSMPRVESAPPLSKTQKKEKSQRMNRYQKLKRILSLMGGTQ